ncbi:MAG: hypothetical protein HYU66_16370, partial [Armatimonadetes bacterium]|nr:hypothetical protein [Armatimonadota bacterium]
TLFGVYAYIVAQATLWTQTSLLRGPVFVLFLIVLANLLLRRWRARLALSERDLLLVYTMQCVATAVGGIGWSQFLVPSLSAPARYASPENHFADFQPHIPAWWWVHDPGVVRSLYQGHSSLYTAANWSGVVRPFLTWSVFMTLLATAALCLGRIFRNQWVERERLTFPLAYLPLEMSRGGGTPSFWSDRLLWLGFGLAAFIDCANSLHFLVPAVPEITVKPVGPLRIDQAWSGRPLSSLRPFVLSFYPFMLGIGFLLTLDISFGCWAWYLILKAVTVVSVELGWADGPLRSGQMPYIPELSVGAFAGLAGLALWRSRRDLWGALRGGWSVDRTALVGLLASTVLIVWFVSAVGCPGWVVAAWLVVYLVYATGCARIVSETGSGWTFCPRITPHEVLLRAGGLVTLNPRQATVFTWLMPFDLDFRDAVMPQQLKGMRLLPGEGGGEHAVLLGLFLAGLVGVVAGMWAHLHVYFLNGIATAATHVYFLNGIATAVTRPWPQQVGRQPFDLLASQLKGVAQQPYRLAGVGAGAGLLLLLVALRTRWLAWPLHPIGFALATTNSLDYLWLPFLLAWAVKSVVLRYGGMKVYRRMLPFFLGMILGDYVVPLFWALYGTFAGRQMYMSFPH